jgi:16S rRNA (guanine966-N2)-methyltransferase
MAQSRRTGGPHQSHSGKVRIIGGALRGSWITFQTGSRTRPMKDRVREAVFSVLGNDLSGYHVLDIFAGTGALGIEALSRGALHAVFIEQHWPTYRALVETLVRLKLIDPSGKQSSRQKAEVFHADAFFWMEHDWQPAVQPIILFCSPPYAFYRDRTAQMVGLVETFAKRAPAKSIAVLESDTSVDIPALIPTLVWQQRKYPPACLWIATIEPKASNSP